MPGNHAENVTASLAAFGYIADPEIATALYLSQQLKKPLLVEGPSGVGKTEIAKVLARVLGTELIRLQCYEGLDAHHALYEWYYQRQLLHLKLEEDTGKTVEEKEQTIFSDAFLMKRPLLQAITAETAPVLLIDELDRADEEFEAFLLELLSDWQISIPEIGTVRATHIPKVILTSNRTRDLSDAVRRRCMYLWIDYPPFDKEVAIVKQKIEGIDDRLAAEISAFMHVIREEQWDKTPGVAETLDWARSLVALHRDRLDVATIRDTLGIIFKDWHDIQKVKPSLEAFFEQVGVRARQLPKQS